MLAGVARLRIGVEEAADLFQMILNLELLHIKGKRKKKPTNQTRN